MTETDRTAQYVKLVMVDVEEPHGDDGLRGKRLIALYDIQVGHFETGTLEGNPDDFKVEDYWYLDPVNAAVEKLGAM